MRKGQGDALSFAIFSLFRLAGEQDVEPVAGWVALCPDLSAVFFCDPLSDGKPKSKAAGTGSCGIGTVEPLEDRL